jgi:hypothetical protein
MKRWLKKSYVKNNVGSVRGLIYERHILIELSKELKIATKIVTKNIRYFVQTFKTVSPETKQEYHPPAHNILSQDDVCCF